MASRFQPGEWRWNVPSLILSILIGGGLGAALGYFGKCSSGSCPLTANWRRGAIYGAVLGLLFHQLSGGGSASLNQSTASVQRITQEQFETEVMQATKPVLLDVYATWCGPCRRLSPLLDELAGPLTNKVKFVKVNLDDAAALAQRFEIQGVPTLLFFKDGKLLDSLVGLPSPGALKARLDSLAAMGAATQKVSAQTTPPLIE
jgi:thioredoxin 1